MLHIIIQLGMEYIHDDGFFYFLQTTGYLFMKVFTST